MALRLVVEAVAENNTALTAAILDSVPPEAPPDGKSATVAGCAGVALGLLDERLSGNHANAPTGLAQQTRLPAGHWIGERAATDILALAAKRRAFRSLHTLTVQQGGRHVLYRRTLALAAAAITWSRHTDTPNRTRPRRDPLVTATILPAVRSSCCDDGWNPPCRHMSSSPHRRCLHPRT
jgi:hypothetical protein